MIQYLVMAIYNTGRNNSEFASINEKPVNVYFDSAIQAVQEVAQGFQELAVRSAKSSFHEQLAQEEEKYKLIACECDNLKKQNSDLMKYLEAQSKQLEKPTSSQGTQTIEESNKNSFI